MMMVIMIIMMIMMMVMMIQNTGNHDDVDVGVIMGCRVIIITSLLVALQLLVPSEHGARAGPLARRVRAGQIGTISTT